LVPAGRLAGRLAIERRRLAEIALGRLRIERLGGAQLAHRLAELAVELGARRAEGLSGGATREQDRQEARRDEGGNPRLVFVHHDSLAKFEGLVVLAVAAIRRDVRMTAAFELPAEEELRAAGRGEVVGGHRRLGTVDRDRKS